VKICHGAIVDNIDTNLYPNPKIDDDRLWNEKALADRKSDNTNPNKKKNNNFRSAWRPVSGSKVLLLLLLSTAGRRNGTREAHVGK